MNCPECGCEIPEDGMDGIDGMEEDDMGAMDESTPFQPDEGQGGAATGSPIAAQRMPQGRNQRLLDELTRVLGGR